MKKTKRLTYLASPFEEVGELSACFGSASNLMKLWLACRSILYLSRCYLLQQLKHLATRKTSSPPLTYLRALLLKQIRNVLSPRLVLIFVLSKQLQKRYECEEPCLWVVVGARDNKVKLVLTTFNKRLAHVDYRTSWSSLRKVINP